MHKVHPQAFCLERKYQDRLNMASCIHKGIGLLLDHDTGRHRESAGISTRCILKHFANNLRIKQSAIKSSY